MEKLNKKNLQILAALTSSDIPLRRKDIKIDKKLKHEPLRTVITIFSDIARDRIANSINIIANKLLLET